MWGSNPFAFPGLSVYQQVFWIMPAAKDLYSEFQISAECRTGGVRNPDPGVGSSGNAVGTAADGRCARMCLESL